ncbi:MULTISPECIES: hypothetical protein [unclassified Rhodanobacter]|uniref:hypothetical protein n=1 Tax=unclassified Rhodanobacter TaxID=2621553 RepID=UPI000AC6F53B|nr:MULTISPECIES: hypothetical protein [unclassified Rhodanobacter]
MAGFLVLKLDPGRGFFEESGHGEGMDARVEATQEPLPDGRFLTFALRDGKSREVLPF